MKYPTSFFSRKVAHPWRWILISIISLIAVLSSFVLYKYPFKSPSSPIEKVLWTSDTERKNFYGPGTPQSLAFAALLSNYALPARLMYSGPVYVAPLEGFGTDSHEISVISPFDPTVGQLIKRAHEEHIRISKKSN